MFAIGVWELLMLLALLAAVCMPVMVLVWILRRRR